MLFPIKNHDIWKIYKTFLASFWTVEEISNLHMDVKDWEQKLTENEKHFIKHILAFFSSADQLICCNLLERFGSEITVPEARQFYYYQIFNESIHAETYALLIDTYISDPEEKVRVLRAIETIPVIKKKAQFV